MSFPSWQLGGNPRPLCLLCLGQFLVACSVALYPNSSFKVGSHPPSISLATNLAWNCLVRLTVSLSPTIKYVYLYSRSPTTQQSGEVSLLVYLLAVDLMEKWNWVLMVTLATATKEKVGMSFREYINLKLFFFLLFLFMSLGEGNSTVTIYSPILVLSRRYSTTGSI